MGSGGCTEGGKVYGIRLEDEDPLCWDGFPEFHGSCERVVAVRYIEEDMR